MRQIQLAFAAVLLAIVGLTLGSTQDQKNPISFFVTSEGPGSDGNFGGLVGADSHGQKLAGAAGAGNRTWRAYLSISAAEGKPAVNVRDRIGKGPWYNAQGVKIAD